MDKPPFLYLTSALDGLKQKQLVVIPCVINITRNISYENELVEDDCTITVLQKRVTDGATRFLPVTFPISEHVEMHHLHSVDEKAVTDDNVYTQFHVGRVDGKLSSDSTTQDEEHRAVFGWMYGYVINADSGCYITLNTFPDLEDVWSSVATNQMEGLTVCPNLVVYTTNECMYDPETWLLCDSTMGHTEDFLRGELRKAPQDRCPALKKLLQISEAMQ